MIFPEKEISTGTESYGRERRREQFKREDFLVVQWLRHCTSNARGSVSIPGQEIKTPTLLYGAAKKKLFLIKKKYKRQIYEVMEICRNWIVVMVVQLDKFTKNHNLPNCYDKK